MLAPLDITTCTDIELLKSEHKRAWSEHRLDDQIAIMRRLAELGAIKPAQKQFLRYDADQRDYDEEADAQGVPTSALLGASRE